MTRTFHCKNCGHDFSIKPYQLKNIDKGLHKLHCPRCQEHIEYTAKPKRQRPTDNNDPTEAQLDYIRKLGGNTTGIKTRQDASTMINYLKKQKGMS